mmetsp:Transcript_68835/g.180393  ORF Transcript_68835/g.180393 Transcript_68835/m.180393 type:complete len:194 (+) Transcript_68835:119-700(+)
MGAGDSHLQTTVCEPQQSTHHRIRLAITPLGAQVPAMVAAYHTSIAIDDVEYTFSRLGVISGRSWQSHKFNARGPGLVLELGSSSFSAADMMQALRPHFREGTYDLLRKNCNSFSDCALYYLLGRRLDGKYAQLEQVAASMDESIGLVQFLSYYSPNPKASGFEVDKIMADISAAGKRAISPPQNQPYTIRAY